MATPLDQAAAPQKQNNQPDVSSDDVELVFRAGVQLMSQGNGIEVIRSSIEESQDPAQVIGQFLAQIMMALAERFGSEIGLDPKVFLAKNGWLELMLDYIETKLKYPPEFSDEVYGQVLEIIKAAAMNPNQAAPQGGPPQGGPPMPAGGA